MRTRDRIRLLWISIAVLGCSESPAGPKSVACSAPTRAGVSIDSRVDLFPGRVTVGDVGAVILTATNTATQSRSGGELAVAIPDGAAAFLAGVVGGSCSNLLSNCIPGAKLSWDLPTLPPGSRRVHLIPARIEEAPSGSGRDISYASVFNWNGGGGSASLGVLRVIPSSSIGECENGTLPPPSPDLKISLAYSLRSDQSGPSAGISISVRNDAGSSAVNSEVRLLIPSGVRSFQASSVSGTCYNVLNNCFPGQIVAWSLGSMGAGTSQSITLSLPLESGVRRTLPICAVVNASSLSGDATCTSFALR